MKNKIYKVIFGYRDFVNYSSVNVLASHVKDAIARAEKEKQNNWYVSEVELLAVADY